MGEGRALAPGDALGAGWELGVSRGCHGLGEGRRPHGSIPRDGVGWGRKCPSPARREILDSTRWEQEMGWGWVAAPGTPPAGPDPSSPHPLARMWGGGIALGPGVKREAAPKGAEGVEVDLITANPF